MTYSFSISLTLQSAPWTRVQLFKVSVICLLIYVWYMNACYICSVKTFACKQTRTWHVPTLTMDISQLNPRHVDPQLPTALPCQVISGEGPSMTFLLRQGQRCADDSIFCFQSEDSVKVVRSQNGRLEHFWIFLMEIILVRLKHGSVVHRLSSMISAV